MHIILETPRLLLRRFTMNDAELLLILNSKPEVLRYVHERMLVNIEDAEKILKEIILPQYTLYGLGRWAVINKQNDEFLGWCGLKLRPETDNEIDLGYRFNPQHWGHGFATEAAAASMQYGFMQKNLAEITGRAHIQNGASLSVLQKIGLQYIKDEIIDDCPVKTYCLTRNQYLEKQAKQDI